MYFQGDKVVYTGTKRTELRNKVGEVCAKVQNSKYGTVVDYGDDSYILDSRNLQKYKPSLDAKEPEVQIRRRRHLDEDE